MQFLNPMSTAELESYVRAAQLDALITFGDVESAYDSVNPSNNTPFPPQWADLVRLHKLVRERKVTTVLEFGVGRSTLILAHALALNRADYAGEVAALRRSNPFELHSLDDMQEFIDLTLQSLTAELKPVVTLHFSPCEMASFADRICTLYRTLPNICPDFIYLDAPSQFSVDGDVRGISTRAPDRMPMAADILTIEHFLLPGTLILVDGRTANARFLKANLQRNWTYRYEAAGDIHLFELVELPLGKINRRQIEFALGREWLERL
ncbi:hypothetical protein FHS85_000127 [Rhodoligotrophos appendicifer]|uniref:class I SAM-dependent methyltransferase n=1 Tax=Rhodoligotrophos appendicifer TaxID=987056 RepID=UPI00117E9ED3|nr:class I SAM-dependent methyltransferase [Rhodoligotrophos appendicifer]